MIIFQNEDQSTVRISGSIPEVIVYDNSTIQKNCSGVTTPLTYNFSKRVYATVFTQTFKKLSFFERTLLENQESFLDLIGQVKGRIYLNINNWHKVLQLSSALYQNKTSLEKVIGLGEPIAFIDEKEKTFGQKCLLLWRKIVHFYKLPIVFKVFKIQLPRVLKSMQSYSADFYKKDLDLMDIRELKAEKANLDKSLSNYWYAPVLNELQVQMLRSTVEKRLKKSGFDNSGELIDTFLAEQQSLANLEPARNLHRLALQAILYPELKVLINRLPADIHSQVQVRFEDFYTEVNHFIDLYGDKTSGELKLETQTMRTEPLIFYRYLRDCLNAQISEIRANSHSRQQALKILEGKLSHLPASRRNQILKRVISLQQAVAHREVFKLERSRMVGMYRALYNGFGKCFVKNNWIESVGDIFYLTEDEILSSGNGHENIFDTLIATRKQEYNLYQMENVPSRVFVFSKIINAIDNETEVPVIHGFDPDEVKAEVA